MDRASLEHAGIDLKRFAPQDVSIPVIFQIDFRNPTAYFAAQNFDLQNKDTVYVDNSGAYEVTKFLSLVTSATSTVTSTADSVTAVGTARDTIMDVNN
jgi:polysaccharide biosynthesis/export protein